MSSNKVYAELSPKGNRIEIAYPASAKHLKAARGVPGRTFIKKGRDGEPGIRFPLDSQTAKLLRQAFGKDLKLGPDLRAWGRVVMERERNLSTLALSDDAELERLPEVLPEVFKMTDNRPFQRADIAFMAKANTLNGNQTGMGKTLETIASVFEAGLDDGPNFVIAPVTSLISTWAMELERLQPHQVITGETVPEREAAIQTATRLAKKGKPFWLVLPPSMIRYERDRKAALIHERGKEVHPLKARYPALFQIEWNVVVVDEAHKTGAANPKTLAHHAFADLKRKLIHFLTATPMGGKPQKLWGYLHLMEPETFSNSWAWTERWFEVIEKTVGWDEANGEQKVREVTQVKPDLEEEFEKSLKPHMVRRLRRQHMADLPPEEHIEVLCGMTPKQRRQYLAFAADAEIRIEEERLSAQGVLAEYARLKQFANAACRVEKYIKYNKETNEHEEKLTVFPTDDSGKLATLIERLDENGVRSDDPEEGARAIVGSESKRMVVMVTEALNSAGITALPIHGGVKGPDRSEAVRAFKANEIQVLVLATTAGGVSLSLEEANSVHILDETWNPDDQDQLWGRGDRGTRTDSLLVYWYRTRETIQEYIHEVAEGKSITNSNILDVHHAIKSLRA